MKSESFELVAEIDYPSSEVIKRNLRSGCEVVFTGRTNKFAKQINKFLEPNFKEGKILKIKIEIEIE